MVLTWHGHSCFSLDTVQGRIVFDPYKDGSVTGLPPLRLSADIVLCSHGHGDHSGTENVTLSGKTTDIAVEYIDTWHDEVKGAKRGPNRIHIVRTEGMTAVHMGDIGCDLSDGELAKIRGCDLLMIPIGGYYTIDSRQALALAEKIGARVTVPMHYRMGGVGYDVLSTRDWFAAHCRKPLYPGKPYIEITADAPESTVILSL